jgi:phage gp36-like protein
VNVIDVGPLLVPGHQEDNKLLEELVLVHLVTGTFKFHLFIYFRYQLPCNLLPRVTTRLRCNITLYAALSDRSIHVIPTRPGHWYFKFVNGTVAVAAVAI